MTVVVLFVNLHLPSCAHGEILATLESATRNSSANATDPFKVRELRHVAVIAFLCAIAASDAHSKLG